MKSSCLILKKYIRVITSNFNHSCVIQSLGIYCQLSNAFVNEMSSAGRWSFAETSNVSSRFLDFGRSNGVSMLELVSTPTKITGVHYVQARRILHSFVKFFFSSKHPFLKNCFFFF